MNTSNTNTTNSMIEISKQRLAELEKLEQDLPTLIEKAILEHKKSNLKRLHEKDKNDPNSVKLRVKRYIAKHRDEINAKRREKRRLKSEAKNNDGSSVISTTETIYSTTDATDSASVSGPTGPTGSGPPTVSTRSRSAVAKSIQNEMPSEIDTLILETSKLTVRFDD